MINSVLAGFLLLVKVQSPDGELRILPGEEYGSMGQCVYVANQLKLAVTNYELDEKVVGAGCIDCNVHTNVQYCFLVTGEGV
jgi:hypothetical protein